MAALGLTGIGGIGGLGGAPRRRPAPTGGMGGGSPFGSPMGGGLSMAPQQGAGAPRQQLVRGVPPPQGYYDPGAMGDIRSGLGYANMANKGYEWLGGSPSGLGGGLGLAGGALGGASAMSRVANGTATPMDYATLARLGYSAYTAAGTGAAAGAGAAGAGAGATGAGMGAGAGMAMWALPAAAAIAAIMRFNEPSASNEEVVSKAIGKVGGPAGFRSSSEQQLADMKNFNYKAAVDRAMQGLGAGWGDVPRGDMESRLGLNAPGGLEGYITRSALSTPTGTGHGVLGEVLDPRYDPRILNQMVGTDYANNVRDRFNTSLGNITSGLSNYLKANPQTYAPAGNPYLYGSTEGPLGGYTSG